MKWKIEEKKKMDYYLQIEGADIQFIILCAQVLLQLMQLWWAVQIKMLWNERPNWWNSENGIAHRPDSDDGETKTKVKAKNCYRNEACRRGMLENWSSGANVSTHEDQVLPHAYIIAHMRHSCRNWLIYASVSKDSGDRDSLGGHFRLHLTCW